MLYVQCWIRTQDSHLFYSLKKVEKHYFMCFINPFLFQEKNLLLSIH